jgi:L-arabinonolactonase
MLHGPPATLNEDQVSVTARLVVDYRCRLGECVLWDDRTNSVLFTSILDQTFHKLQLNSNPTTADLQTYQLPRMLCAFGLLENDSSNAYLLTWEDGFQLYNLEENVALSDMSVGEVVDPLGLPDRLNDGQCDPTGNYFIYGGHTGSNSGQHLKVYKCEYDSEAKQLKHTPVVDAILTTNSICWSNDSKLMYLADSPTLQIHQ